MSGAANCRRHCAAAWNRFIVPFAGNVRVDPRSSSTRTSANASANTAQQGIVRIAETQSFATPRDPWRFPTFYSFRAMDRPWRGVRHRINGSRSLSVPRGRSRAAISASSFPRVRSRSNRQGKVNHLISLPVEQGLVPRGRLPSPSVALIFKFYRLC